MAAHHKIIFRGRDCKTCENEQIRAKQTNPNMHLKLMISSFVFQVSFCTAHPIWFNQWYCGQQQRHTIDNSF
jgi:hypothetical protein